jgi:hypothetical protein
MIRTNATIQLVRDTAKKNESFNGKRFWENHPDY